MADKKIWVKRRGMWIRHRPWVLYCPCCGNDWSYSVFQEALAGALAHADFRHPAAVVSEA